ncbi:MAG: DNA topoisomerase I [Methanobacteriota archaeon]|nr:MAG: DNA topoisomerase I [Euryarchaeota archaeon]
MRRLIICEKNHAARRIALILSNGTYKRRSIAGTPVLDFARNSDNYTVLGLRGHIIELDYPEEYNDWEKTPPLKLVSVEPEKRVSPSAKKIMTALREAASQSDEIIIATDYDREGELIGLEAIEHAESEVTLRRARFSALTKAEIERAFSELVEVDRMLATAAETRQYIDLAWGASLTRFMSLASGQRGSDFLSVGRVQTPTLALIVAREKAIREFVPTPYWLVTASLMRGSQFTASHAHGRFDNREEAHAAASKARSEKQAVVESVDENIRQEYPPPPFNTTMFLAEATKRGLTAASAMKVAEDLYTNGYISYPRTDNTVYPKSLGLKNILAKLRESEFADEVNEILSQKEIRPSRGRTSTTDHPPIHPVEAATKKELKGTRWTVYELVVRRFLATLAPSSEVKKTKVDLSIGAESFIAEGNEILSPGWRKYYPYYRVTEVALPRLIPGDAVEVLKIQSAEKKTKPPTRFSQGTLVQEMEKIGLGTKSTRHEAIQKLFDRRFVKGHRIEPTESGTAVISALEDHAKLHDEYKITDAKMTSHLEVEMDLIAKGEREQPDVLEESQAMLEDIIDVLERNKKEIGDDIRKALRKQRSLGACPKCEVGELVEIRAKSGDIFAGCSSYPECRNTYPLPHGMLVLPADASCDVCNAPKIKTVAKGQAPTVLCIDPKCSGAMKQRHVGKCPECGGDITTIQSRKGKRFAGCTNYPDCRKMYPLPQKGKIVPTEKACDVCAAPVIKVWQPNNRKPWVLCINMDCPGKRKKAPDAKVETRKKPKRR